MKNKNYPSRIMIEGLKGMRMSELNERDDGDKGAISANCNRSKDQQLHIENNNWNSVKSKQEITDKEATQ